jgi:hypothetical protein
MRHRIGALLWSLIYVFSLSPVLFGQQSPAPAPSAASPSPSITVPAGALEFPIIFEQNVVAGKTAVGTPVQAKLVVATLMNGVVIPKNAVFSGVVTDSAEKSKTDPSRLAIRMDSAQWKGGSIPIKVCLTPWFYPSVEEGGQNLQYGPTKSDKDTWNGQGQYPSGNSKIYQPFPGRDTDQGSAVPNTPTPVALNHRVAMKNVEVSLDSDGVIILASKHSNLKLDKFTTYVLANGELLPPPKDTHNRAAAQ